MKAFFAFGAFASAATISLAGMILPGAASASAGAADPNAGIAAQVKSYFADIPVMIAIAKCESGDRQFMGDGAPLLGGTGAMVGIFQFDRTVHYDKALTLGFDIDTVEGNMGYARYLYGAAGTGPWISSFGCWNTAPTSTVPPVITTSTPAGTVTPALTLDLSLGSIDPQVLVLQQLLNGNGFTLATSGPGSPGNETIKFGALTYAALKKFQCARGIACSGEESTTGYGFLNGATRAALLAATPGNGTSTIAAANADDNPAEIAELQSRIAALMAIVSQLEARIAARNS